MPLTQEQAQAVVEEIRAVCQKHGVGLVGGDPFDGLSASICLFPIDEVTVDESLIEFDGQFSIGAIK